jgi:CheY-like chemotaxis protein
LKVNQLNILLADDDMDDCLFFKEALEALPISTGLTAVHNGEQLMQLLSNETNKLPHLLFLDLNMPRKNGFECLSEIKKNKKLKDLPVVIFSTSFEQEVVNLLYDNGAQFFIRKPSEFTLFKKIILHTLMLIIQNDVSQPAKENFVLTVESSLVK